MRLEPTSPLFWHRLAVVALLTDDAEMVDAVMARIATIDSTYLYSLTTPFRHALCHGRMDDARAALERAYAATPDAVATMLFLFRWSQGDPTWMTSWRASCCARPCISTHPPCSPRRAMPTCSSPASPQRGTALRYSANGVCAPIGRPMLTDARAHALLRDYGFEAYWREKGWPAQCRPVGTDDFECGAPAGKAG